MPRRLFQISKFDRGMVGNMDAQDAQEDVASVAFNVDPSSAPGYIQGVEGRTVVSNGVSGLPGFDVMKVLQTNSGASHVVGVDYDGQELGIVENYRTSPAYTDLGSVNNFAFNTVDHASIEVNNNQAYVGLGKGNSPRWIGKINNEQFGVSAGSGYYAEKSELTPPRALRYTSSSQIAKLGGGMSSAIYIDSLFAVNDLPSSGVVGIPVQMSDSDTDTPVPGQWYMIYVKYEGIVVENLKTKLYNLTWPQGIRDEIAGYFGYTIGWSGEYYDAVFYSDVFVATFEDQAQRINEYSSALDNRQGGWIFHDEGTAFAENTFYGLGVSYVYDGYKESPITRVPGADYWGGKKVKNGNSYNKASINALIQGIYGTNRISRRITHIKFYINQSSGEHTEGYPRDASSFRLVHVQEISEAPEKGLYLNNGNDIVGYLIGFVANGYEGSTFTQQSGLSEFVESTSLNYGISAQLNSELFIGQVKNNNAPDEDWSNYIVKSKELVYESFDWSEDYLVLPNPITAIASHAGRIYAFDEFNMYRINPQRMYIEDEYSGLGAINQQCVVSTEYGLFVASSHGISVFDGREIRNISKPIESIEDVSGFASYGYINFVDSHLTDKKIQNIRLGFDSKKNMLVLYGVSSSEGSQVWMYNVLKQTWFIGDIQTVPAWCPNEEGGLISSATNTSLYDLFRGSRLAFEWYSKKISAGGFSQTKKFRKVEVSASGYKEIKYRIDDHNGAFQVISNLDSSSVSSNGNWIQLYVKVISGYTKVRSINLLYRQRSLPA